jgi:hypothetical protein
MPAVIIPNHPEAFHDVVPSAITGTMGKPDCFANFNSLRAEHTVLDQIRVQEETQNDRRTHSWQFSLS